MYLMSNNLARQGDVLIRRVKGMPAQLTEIPREGGRVVLAHGEVTGHSHAIACPRATLYMDIGSGPGGRRYLSVTGDDAAVLEHEEHDAVAIPPGCYEIVGQREYSPEAVRRVAD